MLNRTLACSPAIVFLPKAAENLHAYKNLYQMFIAAVFIIVIISKQPRYLSVGKQINNGIYAIYSIYAMKCYSVLRRHGEITNAYC